MLAQFTKAHRDQHGRSCQLSLPPGLAFAKPKSSLLEELSAIYPVKTLHAMYQLSTDEPYSFWYINLVAKRKEDMFFVRFEHKIAVD